MDKNTYLDGISNRIKKIFDGEKNILSLYIYGSVLSDQFDPRRSDIDLLIICRDLEHPFKYINGLKNKLSALKDVRIDANIVFLSEFKKRWHIYRPPSYYLGIKYRHKLILGKDLITDCKDSEVTPEQIYKRIVDLAQGSRGVYVNGKDPEFWAKKYAGWLKVAVLETLFLTGEFDLSFFSGVERFLIKYPELKLLARLKEKSIDIGEVNEMAETLRVFFQNNFLKSK